MFHFHCFIVIPFSLQSFSFSFVLQGANISQCHVISSIVSKSLFCRYYDLFGWISTNVLCLPLLRFYICRLIQLNLMTEQLLEQASSFIVCQSKNIVHFFIDVLYESDDRYKMLKILALEWILSGFKSNPTHACL